MHTEDASDSAVKSGAEPPLSTASRASTSPIVVVSSNATLTCSEPGSALCSVCSAHVVRHNQVKCQWEPCGGLFQSLVQPRLADTDGVLNLKGMYAHPAAVQLAQVVAGIDRCSRHLAGITDVQRHGVEEGRRRGSRNPASPRLHGGSRKSH